MALTINSRTTVTVDLNTYFYDKAGRMTYQIIPDRNPYSNATITGLDNNLLNVSGAFRGTSYLIGVRATNSYGLFTDGFIPVTEAGVKNCVVTTYPDWNTIPCNPDGTKTRTRRIISQPEYGGTPCPNDMSQTINCDFDCVINSDKPWRDRTPCNNNGWIYEEPNIVHHSKNGGRACPTTRSYPCDVNCQYTWGGWSGCDQGSGTRFRDPSIRVTAKNNGARCPGREWANCAVNCQGWYGGCSRGCEGVQHFNVSVWPKHGGAGCPGNISCGGDCVRGSYAWSCNNQQRQGNLLFANCKRAFRIRGRDQWNHGAVIDAYNCNGRDIWNDNGDLRC